MINGSKIWTSGGHHANQMFTLVRTDPDAPKHKGISFLIIDDLKNTPGVTIRPLINMADHHHFNEVFFEDVRVPAGNRVGEEHRGWYVGMTLLDYERSGIGTTAAQRRTLELLAADLRDRDTATRERRRTQIADLVVANNVAKYLGYRIGHLQASGRVPNYEASVVKIFQSELGQRIFNWGVNYLGLGGQLRPGDPAPRTAATSRKSICSPCRPASTAARTRFSATSSRSAASGCPAPDARRPSPWRDSSSTA